MFAARIEKARLNNLVLLLILFIILHFCFALTVRNEYAFRKAQLVYEFNLLNFIVSTLCICIHTFLVTALKIKDFMYSVAILILVFFVFPSAVIFTFVRDIDWRIFLSHNLFFLTVLLVGKIRIKIQSSRIPIVQSKNFLLLIVIVGLIPFVLLYFPYLNFRNLLLQEIYETRALMRSEISNVYTGYSYSWFNKFIIPCLLVFGIYYKDRFTIIISSLSLVFLFLCGANKVVFVGLILTFILYKYDYITKINYFLKILIGIGLFALLASVIFSDDFIMTMSIRRAFLLPAMIDVLYFDFFNNNHLFWSESFNGLFQANPYELEHAYVIGENYFGDINWGANNGIISDGFMNAGMVGLVINITIVDFYFSFLNQLNISPKFFGLFFLFVFVIISSALTTVLLTHGGIILLLLSVFFLKNTDKQMV